MTFNLYPLRYVSCMSFKDHVRSMRTAQGLTQAALAEAAGVSRLAIVRWESGYSKPTCANVGALLDALGIHAESARCAVYEAARYANAS